MTKVLGFRIENFKGIEKVNLAVEGGKSPGRFISLVGLNESGKTSIIEALSMSILQDETSRGVTGVIDLPTDVSRIVPKHQSAGFTGTSNVSVKLDFSEEIETLDIIKRIIKDAGLKIVGNIDPVLEATKLLEFEDSSYKGFRTTWGFIPKVVQAKSRKQVPVTLFQKDRKAWTSCINEFKKALPKVIYFPTFLVNMPKRIYLEGSHSVEDTYYRNILSDVMSGLNTPLDLKRHILDRAHPHKTAANGYSSSLRASNDGVRINDTVQQIAAELNRVVFGAWHDIFQKPVKNRSIVVEWHIDEQKENHIYLELYIVAGRHRYSLNERSLGFRWFFSFLLFTQFQRNRTDNKKIVFLFDEPASHLHPKAQERLLRSFDKIADPNHIIIYSTHSHYLLNPIWIEQSYVVANSAIDDTNDDTGMDGLESKVTITATPYKSFATKHPGKTTYYQPILDVLDFSSHGLDLTSPLIILEGKYDYHPFMYFVRELGYAEKIRVIPSVGAGGMSALIGILKGWHIKFLIILDDDSTGRKEKGKYKNDLLLSNNHVITLDEISHHLSGKEFEDIFLDDVRDAVMLSSYSNDDKVTKENIHSFFLDAFNDKTSRYKFPATSVQIENFLKIFMSKLYLQ
ncbi:AAA family ATPase [Sphingomonas sanguinis]|uniref:AAA family ATPase n=1 Tax=Sphingomonas sanguinis TaxID=33051 RepID=UPI000A8EBF86|nr:AAA family ATPase [Sphingomonas sanguinis]